ncbi:unnamed protein product [Thlaspi arvense]|uniref:Calcium-transporting ATPase n=1 Tax=Thlaspi arvense TaxID=13288 RepID=A0AAU9TEV4_THLAR|nr:unnamed protein product [Thlaspi arvense]
MSNKPCLRSFHSRGRSGSDAGSDAVAADVPDPSGEKPRKRWRFAYSVISSIHAMRCLAKEAKIVVKGGHSALDIDPEPGYQSLVNQHHQLIDEDKEILKVLVKEKNLGLLSRLGGVEGIVDKLQSNADRGIRAENQEVSARKELYGSNTYNKPPAKGFVHFLWTALKDATIIVLIVCAVLSLGFGIKEDGIKEGWYNGASILVAVFLVVVISAVTNFRQSKQFEELSKISSNIQVEVVRDGRPHNISIFDIVVGDVVILKIGGQIPADGLFLKGYSLQVDESSMTGESEYVDVDKTTNPFLLSGAKVANGYARMVVTAVGMDTAWGEMMSAINLDLKEETPLQTRLNHLTSSIGKIGLAVAFFVLVAMLTRYFTGSTKDENGRREFVAGQTKLGDVMNSMVHIVAAAVTIIVVAIPEGLPLAVTLTLAYSMKRMMRDQALVRKLSACETMGSATVICTDKTGTLTLNLMTVTTFWLGKDRIQSKASEVIAPNILELLYQGVAKNTAGSVYKDTPASETKFTGSPTEKAILLWAVQELGMEIEKMEQEYEILHVETFNSVKKRSGVLIKDVKDDTLHVHWKGAAEIILAMCTSYYDKSGMIKVIDDGTREEIKKIIEGMAAKALRCIAFTHKQITKPAGSEQINVTLDEDDLTFLGIVGLKDPCRPEVKQAVALCKKAGVHVKMITGDNIFTAKAIAAECGILEANHSNANRREAIEGVEFRNYSQEERLRRVNEILVMARSSPIDKLEMVKCLKQKGDVVAVTGDGTNDAPALKEADVGLSMGIQGTEVAKESSDIVILDDNFNTVVTVLKWGRCVYNSIQKFVQFQLTVNVAALVINLIAACTAGEVPLTAIQLMWINLIMDSLGALALATERPTDELMVKPPVGRSTEPLITNVMWRNLTFQAFFQVIILLILNFKGKSLFHVNTGVKNTLIFNTFVLCQIFNEFNARRLEDKNVFKGILGNRMFLWIVVTTLILQVAMVEFLSKFANTERLNLWQWGVSIIIAAVSWPLAWIVKSIPVPEQPYKTYLYRRCKWFKTPS